MTYHFGYELGRVLQIRVDNHHRIAASMIEPGGHSYFFAEVTAQLQNSHSRIYNAQVMQNLQ